MTGACGRQPLGQKTAEPGGQDDAEKADAERIDRMAEKHRDALDQPDLREHEAKPDQQKIAAADQRQFPVDLANGGSRRQDDDIYDHQGRQEDDQEKRADGDEVAAPARARIERLAFAPFAQGEEDVARIGKSKLVEEERPRVGGRRHVEEMARCPCIQVLEVLRREHVEDDRVRSGPVRAREHGEAQFVGGTLQDLQVGSGEWRARHDGGGEIADPGDEDVVAGAFDAEFHQRGDGQADDAAELDRRTRRVPPGHGEQAVRRERREKSLPALDRIEPVLREREGAGAGGRPGVDHAHFDQVEFLRGPREPAPTVVDHEAHAREVGNAGVGAQLGGIREQVDEDGIELDAGDVAEPEQMGR